MASDKKPSMLMGTIVPLVVLTLVAGGGGALIGMQIVNSVRAKAMPVTAPTAETAAAPASAATHVFAVKELAPIVTNLMAPEGAYVRLQTAVVYDKSDAAQIDLLAARIGEDSLSFVKTLTTAQLQGASGLQHLREDLNERASLRSDGRIHEMVIEMLVVQ